MTERRADDAAREVDAWLKCEFLKDRIDEEFDGVIAAVTNFGVFVELSDLYIEGLIHVSALPGDYYHFDQAKQRLVGERTRQIFKLGGAVTVRVARVDLDDRKIDLELAGRPSARAALSAQRKSKASKKPKPGQPKNETKKKRASSSESSDAPRRERSTGRRKSGSTKSGATRKRRR